MSTYLIPFPSPFETFCVVPSRHHFGIKMVLTNLYWIIQNVCWIIQNVCNILEKLNIIFLLATGHLSKKITACWIEGRHRCLRALKTNVGECTLFHSRGTALVPSRVLVLFIYLLCIPSGSARTWLEQHVTSDSLDLVEGEKKIFLHLCGAGALRNYLISREIDYLLLI